MLQEQCDPLAALGPQRYGCLNQSFSPTSTNALCAYSAPHQHRQSATHFYPIVNHSCTYPARQNPRNNVRTRLHNVRRSCDRGNNGGNVNDAAAPVHSTNSVRVPLQNQEYPRETVGDSPTKDWFPYPHISMLAACKISREYNVPEMRCAGIHICYNPRYVFCKFNVIQMTLRHDDP